MAEDEIHANWPKLPDGTVDWETVFENPDDGLIQLIEAARKSKTLIDCTAMIIQTLFTRNGDEDVRAKYTQKLAIIATSDLDDLSGIASKTTTILRAIKDDRIKRAAEWAAHKQERAAAREQERQDEERHKRLRQSLDETEAIFSDVYCDTIDQKFQVMWTGVPQETLDGRKLPFIVSSDFARTFENVVRDTFMPWIIANCRYIISEAKRKDTDQRKEYLEQRINDPGTHKELWNIWNVTWRHFMEEKEYPAKPKEEKGGIFGSISRVVKDAIADEGEYTREDWDHDVEIIDKQNAECREIKARLLNAHSVYLAPQEEDMTRLMNLFAIVPGDLRKEISALRQISEDMDSSVRVFESFSKGKDLELALIAISFQNPDLFLRGEKMLVHLLRGKKEHERYRDLPFLMRELGDLFDQADGSSEKDG